MLKLTKFISTNTFLFKNISLEFSPNLNIFCGPNGVGKSKLLQFLYELCYWDETIDYNYDVNQYFRWYNNNNILKSGESIGNGYLSTSADDVFWEFDLYKLKTKTKVKVMSNNSPSHYMSDSPVFLDHWLSDDFPDNDYFLPDNLTSWVATDGLYRKQQKKYIPIKTSLEKLSKTRFSRGKRGFYYYISGFSETSIPGYMLSGAERKIAHLIHLVKSGTIARDGILFWDTPESDLDLYGSFKSNERHRHLFRRFIATLMNFNVQIFVATNQPHLFDCQDEMFQYPELHSSGDSFGIDPIIRVFEFSKKKIVQKPIMFEI
jgi:energy-coupling factor transporter ATP-binding protein EcfA2